MQKPTAEERLDAAHWEAVEEATELLHEERFHEALTMLREILRADTKNPYAFYFTGVAMFEVGELAPARDAYRACIALAPKHVGARVALCELDRIGGTCVLRGCVPKKLLVYGATFAQDFVDAAGFGWELGSTRCDWAMLQAAKERELDRLNGAYKRMLADAKVTTFSGRAELVDAHTVAIGEQRITAERILLATGGWPLRPEVPGSELGITSNEALSLPAVPRRLIVVGGGYIGVEFAGIYAALGTQVTMVVRGPLPLRGFDEEAREHLAALLVKRGIALRPHSQLASIERSDDGSLVVRLQSGDVLLGDQVLLATGRGPNTRGLGLERVGVECRPSGAIAVNEFSQSSVASIYAIGD